MAQFYTDDICAFKADPAIVGTVAHTWRDVDGDSMEAGSPFYVHSDTPEAVRHGIFHTARPCAGYVILSFEQPYDFYCLVPESELILVDRALSAGDVVKRQLSDAQSGTIISTSLRCTLRPQCFADEYAAKSYPQAHGIYSKAKAVKRSRSLSKSRHHEDQIYDIPAQELEHWNRYREEDYIIYRDWIGKINRVSDEEVTVRLGNGSIVVVDDANALRESYWLKGSFSSRLHQRLRSMKYEFCAHPGSEDHHHGRLWDPEEIYVGQIIETQKDNLRCGRWLFGEYNAKVEPRGIVVAVRPTQIEVSWIYPNMFKPYLTQRTPPPKILDLDTLESNAVTIYDRSRKPARANSSHLVAASYSPDITFGSRVRFRAIAGAAVKYSSSDSSHGIFKRIPRTATQGYDMNVLQVVKTSTTVTVQWQDASVTTEDSISLVPYNNVDDYDVWPGSYVSFKGREIDHKDTDVTLCNKIGVVQAADAHERIASVRWFSAPIAAIPKWDPYQTVPPTRYGSISEIISEVSFYEVMAHPALARTRGDLLIVVPDPLPPIDSVDRPSMPDAFRQLVKQAYQFQETSDSYACQSSAQAHTRSTQTAEVSISRIPPSTANDIDWFGEVVDLGLDGNMIVRLGAADEVRDVNIPYERVVLVAGSDDDSVASDEEMEDEDSKDEEVVASDEETENKASEDDESSASVEETESEASDNSWETDNAVDNESAEVNIPRTGLPRKLNNYPRTIEKANTPGVGILDDDESVASDEESAGNFKELDLIPLSPSPSIGVRLKRLAEFSRDLRRDYFDPDESESHVSKDGGTPNLRSTPEDDESSIRIKNPSSIHTPGDQGPHGTLMYRLNRGERGIEEDPGQPFTERFQRLLEAYDRHKGPRQTQNRPQERPIASRGAWSRSDQSNFDQPTHTQPAAHEPIVTFDGHIPLLDVHSMLGRVCPPVTQLPQSIVKKIQASLASLNGADPQPTGTTVMPSQFAILSQPPPEEHHFVSRESRLTSTKMRRITKEHQILRSSLPENVFVRTWDERLDLLRVLIIGPRGTPHELAPFLIDFHMGEEFPAQPPEAYFHSWTNGIGRVNPNLYEDGKICLSLLGTWPGDSGSDTWSAKSSTLLQVIVSIMGLVLVREPYYNEAGFDVLAGTDESTTTSALYTERAYVLSRGFVQPFFEKDPAGMSDIRHWMYISTDGPRLIDPIYEEAKVILDVIIRPDQVNDQGMEEARWRPANEQKRLSRGVGILLGRMMAWLHARMVAPADK